MDPTGLRSENGGSTGELHHWEIVFGAVAGGGTGDFVGSRKQKQNEEAVQAAIPREGLRHFSPSR